MKELGARARPIKTPLRILFLQERGEEIALIESLEKGGFDVSSHCVKTAQQFVVALGSEPWDAIIADVDLSGAAGIDVLSVFDAIGNDIPFILVSDAFIEEMALSAIKAGACDYVTRDRVSLLRSQRKEMRYFELRNLGRQPRPAEIGNVPGEHVERPYSAGALQHACPESKCQLSKRPAGNPRLQNGTFDIHCTPRPTPVTSLEAGLKPSTCDRLSA